MGKLAKTLFGPFKRSAKNRSESRQEPGAGSELPEGPSSVPSRTNREKHGLFRLHSSTHDDEFSVDIVAVHGLSGDWESSWTDSDSQSLWLEDFLPSQFPSHKLRIWSFGYDSATTFTNSVADIDDAAKALVNALDGERQTRNSRIKPIIFIAHSLGGIIVKRAINLANERSELWKDVVDSVFGIIFFAVPHRGADAAFLATMMANVYSFATLGFAGNKNFVKALKRNSPVFWQISNAFIQPASKVMIIRSFYETDKIANHLIVDKDSASLGLNNERAVPIQGANHRDICKFSSDRSQKYRPVRNAMRDIIEAALGRDDTGTEEDAFLSNLCFPGMLASLGYKHDTEYHEWLFHNNTFDEWMRHQERPGRSRFLWITGTPGSGKTTAMRGAYHRLLQEPAVLDGAHHVAAFFFQKNDDALLRDSNGMYRSLLYQILRRQKKMIGTVLRSKAPSLSRNGAQHCHEHTDPDYRSLLLDTLRRACRRLQPTIIFIDALDECVDGDMGLWDAFFHIILTSDDFKTLGVCVSSRHLGISRWLWLRPLDAFGTKDTISKLQSPVIEVDVENQSAIRAYIDEKVGIYRSDTKALVKFNGNIQRSSSGNFLWVEDMVDRLIDDLRGHNSEPLELRIKPTPERLKQLYHELLCAAEEPTKTWRFFHWLFMAPDLSLRAWRDLIPFLQDKAPRSLKHSRNSEDWAEGSTAPGQDDAWLSDLQQIVCRISVGLAHVVAVSSVDLEGPVGDQHSVFGQAGSWNTADGEKRLIRPIHPSLKQYLLDEGGFDALEPRLNDHRGEGLLMAMTTCLDFVQAREFSKLDLKSGGSINISGSPASTVSLLSNGDVSSLESISRFSSAHSSQHNSDHHRPLGNFSYSSTGSSSTGGVESGGKSNRTKSVLAQLSREATRCPETWEEKASWIKRWCDTAGASRLIEERNPPVPPSRTPPTKSLRWKNWSSELLSYILTAFPEFARTAERSGIDSKRIIIRLRNNGLWEHWLRLSDHMPTDTTLEQWADLQQLQSWAAYLSRTNILPNLPGALGGTQRRHQNLADHNINLNYCFDGGDQFVKEVGSDTFHFTHEAIPSYGLSESSFSLEILESRLMSATSYSWGFHSGTPHESRFIPYKSLLTILTGKVVAELLTHETKLALEKAIEVRESYIKVLAILILIDHASSIEQFFEAGIDDRCLPLKLERFSGAVVCDIPSKDTSVLDTLNTEKDLFEKTQWLFLSPFLAQPAGQLHHYIFRSPMHTMPVLERGGYMGRDVNRVELHPQSFDFGEDEETFHMREGRRNFYIVRTLRGSTWKRFLSIANACRLVSECEDQVHGVLPLLCTVEHPNPTRSLKSDYHLIFPSPEGGNLIDLCGIDPRRQLWWAQVTERWLVSQCSRMASTLVAIRQTAARKFPQLPRCLFLRSGRLAAEMVYRISCSPSQVGTLALGNFAQEPPQPYEAGPELDFVVSKKSTKGPNQDSGTDKEFHMKRPRRSRAGAPTFSASKFHVWCLATIWLRLITWFILGPDTRHFSKPGSIFDQFSGLSSASGFFEKLNMDRPTRSNRDTDNSTKSYWVKPSVVKLIKQLKRHKSCTVSIKRILTLIQRRMLVIDPAGRASTQEVMEILQEIDRESEELQKT